MGITYYVATVFDEEMEEEDREATREQLDELNDELKKRGLPEYRDPEDEERAEFYWNSTLTMDGATAFFANLLAIQEQLLHDLDWDIFPDPIAMTVHYLPIRFEGLIIPESAMEEDGGCGCGHEHGEGHDHAHEHEHEHEHDGEDDPDFVSYGYASSYQLRDLLLQVGERLGIPFAEFEPDLDGDGSAQHGSWSVIMDRMIEEEAPIFQIDWSTEVTEDSLREMAEQAAEAFGIDQDDFLASQVEEHGSLAAAVEAMNANQPEAEELSRLVVVGLLNYWHGAELSIRNGLPFLLG